MEDENTPDSGEDDYESYYEQLQYLADLLRAQNLRDTTSEQRSSDSEEEFSSPIGRLDSVHSKMTDTDIEAEIGKNLSVAQNRKKQRKVAGSSNIVRLISEGNIFGRYEETVKRRILSNFLPSNPCRVAQYRHKVFCGRYCGEAGERFMTASQDCRIRIYNTQRGQFSSEQEIEVR